MSNLNGSAEYPGHAVEQVFFLAVSKHLQRTHVLAYILQACEAAECYYLLLLTFIGTQASFTDIIIRWKILVVQE